MIEDIELIFDSSIRLAATLLLAGLGELIAERAGTINISIEGMLLSGAFGAAYGSHVTGSATTGLIIGSLVGLFVGLGQANLSHRLKVNQFIIGLVINFFVLGVTSFLAAELSFRPIRFSILEIPLINSIPILGSLFSQRTPFFLLFILVPLTWWLLYKTRWGLEIRSVGEDPEAAAISGVPVLKRRRQAIYICGLLSGLAGSYLSIGHVGSFTPNMTALRGFVVIAAVILGGWRVKGAIAGCLLFGGVEALRVSLPALGVTLFPQLLISLPYLAALLTLTVIGRSNRQPKELGKDFDDQL